MKKITKLLLIPVLTGGLLFVSCNQNSKSKQNSETQVMNHDSSDMMHSMSVVKDKRISLNLSPKKAQHQLSNMRSHLQAVQNILNYLSKNEFDSASNVASAKLGLSEEMKMMCSSFGNEEFEELGLGFHKSADKMSAIFKTKDKDKSLEALSLTLNYCITCHSNFRQ